MRSPLCNFVVRRSGTFQGISWHFPRQATPIRSVPVSFRVIASPFLLPALPRQAKAAPCQASPLLVFAPLSIPFPIHAMLSLGLSRPICAPAPLRLAFPSPRQSMCSYAVSVRLYHTLAFPFRHAPIHCSLFARVRRSMPVHGIAHPVTSASSPSHAILLPFFSRASFHFPFQSFLSMPRRCCAFSSSPWQCCTYRCFAGSMPAHQCIATQFLFVAPRSRFGGVSVPCPGSLPSAAGSLCRPRPPRAPPSGRAPAARSAA